MNPGCTRMVGALGVAVALSSAKSAKAEGYAVRFESTPPGMSLYVRDRQGEQMALGGGRYRKLCDGRCELTLEPGRYDTALSLPGELPRQAREPVEVRGPGRLEGEWVSRSMLRGFGWGLMIGGPVAGAIVLAVAIDQAEGCGGGGAGNDSCQQPAGTVPLIAFSTLTFGGLLGGLALILQRDQTSLRFVPGAVPLAPATPRDARVEAGVLPGLRVDGRF